MRKIMLVIAACILAGGAYCSPVRTNVGGRQSCLVSISGRGYTAADYVQDGLLVMWDSIENIGHGKHEIDSKKWIDLSGHGYDLDIADGTEWADNYFDTMGIRTAAYSTFPLIKDNVPMTIECVFDASLSSGYGAVLTIFNNSYCQWVGIRANDSVNFRNNGAFFFADRTKPIAASYTASAVDDFALYYNGSYQIDGSPGLNGIGIGSYMRIAYNSPLRLKIYCVRAYLRVLSEEEIAYNYMIDKERFDL